MAGENDEIEVNESPEQPGDHAQEAIVLKTCKHKACGKEYKPRANNRSSFCSEKCRILHKSGLSGTDEPVKPIASGSAVPQNVSLPTPRVTGLEPHLQMAFDMLVANEKQWKEWYQQKSKSLDEAQEQIKQLQDKLKDKEHAEQLSGIEDAKPTLFGKILGELPPSWQDAVVPVIGALAQKAATQMGGTDGQLDDASQHVMDWIKSQPDNVKQEMSNAVVTLMSITDSDSLAEAMKKINSVLMGGSTIVNEQPKQQQSQNDQAQLMMGLM